MEGGPFELENATTNRKDIHRSLVLEAEFAIFLHQNLINKKC